MTNVLFNKNFSITAAQIQALRGSRYTAWASHSDPTQAMMAAAEHSFLEPKGLLGKAYGQWLLKACLEHDIDIVIAGKERGVLANMQADFKSNGIQMIAASHANIQRHLERKDEFLLDWDSRILPIPEWASFDSLAGFDTAVALLKQEGTRLCMKPSRGIYASGFRVLVDKPDLKTFLDGELYHMSYQAARELLAGEQLPIMLLMHTLEGDERSIDCVAWQGRLIRAVVRRKDPNQIGEQQQIEERPDLQRAAKQIAEKYQLSGVFNFQTKDDCIGPEGIPHMLEINARASGGLRYSMAAGVNFPLLLLDAATDHLNWTQLPSVQTGLRVAQDKGVRVC